MTSASGAGAEIACNASGGNCYGVGSLNLETGGDNAGISHEQDLPCPDLTGQLANAVNAVHAKNYPCTRLMIEGAQDLVRPRERVMAHVE